MSLRENIKTKLWAQVREQWTTETETTFTVRARQPGANRAQRSSARQIDRQTHGRHLLSLSPSLSLFSPFQPWAHLLPLSPPNHPCPNKWNKPAQVQTGHRSKYKDFANGHFGLQMKTKISFSLHLCTSARIWIISQEFYWEFMPI